MAWVCDSDSIREAVGSAAGTVDRSGSPSCPDQLTYFAGSRADSAANQAWRLQPGLVSQDGQCDGDSFASCYFSGSLAFGSNPGGAPEHAAEAQAVLDTPGQASSGPRKRGRPALCAQGPEGPIEHVDLAMLQAGGYLDMPIAQAARTLGMSLTSMKVTASEQGIQRWPFRSRQSLRHIIENTKQLVVDKVLSIQDGLQMEQLLDALGEELQDVGMSPTPCISATIRRYRQSIFKITHKLKTTPGLHATVPIAVRTALAARKPPHAMVHN
ncbi:hypothetical protein WJX72_008652 [[Myrmecia] bisecta]|uniref:RWP-RK domain-containing protein n=1 Tax=[Myrmecia] bisecta TaxID=41462 RepID=A0AAW1QSI5_9CHLO